MAPAAPGLLALNGFDAVSYFLPGASGPRPGRPGYEIVWRGLTWRFASAGNRDAFAGDPIVYAPRLGGYDPVGVLEGRLVDADPLVFAILQGPAGEGLYLFRNAEHRARLVASPDLVAAAESRWPTLKGLTDTGAAP